MGVPPPTRDRAGTSRPRSQDGLGSGLGRDGLGRARRLNAATDRSRRPGEQLREAEALVPVLQALAEPTRWRAVELLSLAPRRAGELADALGVSAPTMSKHLRTLLSAGVVTDERPAGDARTRVFRLREEPVMALKARLDQIQAHWDEQLATFRTHVEARSRR